MQWRAVWKQEAEDVLTLGRDAGGDTGSLDQEQGAG